MDTMDMTNTDDMITTLHGDYSL